MGVLDTLIVTTCLGVSGPSNQACNKALEAGTKQTGVESQVDSLETKTTKMAEKDAKQYLGETSVFLLTGTAMATKAVIDKSATVKLPTLGICNSITANVGPQKSLLSLMWKF